MNIPVLTTVKTTERVSVGDKVATRYEGMVEVTKILSAYPIQNGMMSVTVEGKLIQGEAKYV